MDRHKTEIAPKPFADSHALGREPYSHWRRGGEGEGRFPWVFGVERRMECVVLRGVLGCFALYYY